MHLDRTRVGGQADFEQQSVINDENSKDGIGEGGRSQVVLDLVFEFAEALHVCLIECLFRDTSEGGVALDDEEPVDDGVELVKPDLEQIELAAHQDGVYDDGGCAVDICSLRPAMQGACVAVDRHAVIIVVGDEDSWTIWRVP